MSWEQLRDITAADVAERAYWRAQPPRACPVDGTPLKQGPPGSERVLFCPMGDFDYPADWFQPSW